MVATVQALVEMANMPPGEGMGGAPALDLGKLMNQAQHRLACTEPEAWLDASPLAVGNARRHWPGCCCGLGSSCSG